MTDSRLPTAEIIRDLENKLEGHKKVLERYANKVTLLQQQKAMLVSGMARVARELGWKVSRHVEHDEHGIPATFIEISFPGAACVFHVEPHSKALFEKIPSSVWESVIAPWLEAESAWPNLLSDELTVSQATSAPPAHDHST